MGMKAEDKAELRKLHEAGSGAAHEMDAAGGNISEMRGSELHAELDGTPAAAETCGAQ